MPKVSIIPPLSQQITDTASGYPTKPMIDFMSNISSLVSLTRDSVTDVADKIKDFDSSSEAIVALNKSVAEMLDMAKTNEASVAEWTRIYQSDSASLAEKVNLMSAAIGDNAAAIMDEQVAKVDLVSSEAMRRQTLATEFNMNIGSIVTELNVITTEATALAQSLTTLTATVETNTSAISTEATTRANADSALAQSLTTLTATVGTNTSAISTEATTRANADSAEAAARTSLATTVGSHSTTISEFLASINGIEGRWGVVINAAGHMTGIQLIGSETSSTLVIDADVLVNGSITTSKITANAVTNIVSTSNSGTISVTLQRTWTTLLSITITVVGGSVLLLFDMDVYLYCNGFGTSAAIRVERDSTILYEASIVGNDSRAVSVRDDVNRNIYQYVSAGTHVFYIRGYIDDGVCTITGSSLTAIDIKR